VRDRRDISPRRSPSTGHARTLRPNAADRPCQQLCRLLGNHGARRMEPKQWESLTTVTWNSPVTTFILVKDQARMDLQLKLTYSLPRQFVNNNCPKSRTSHFGNTGR